MVKRAFIGVDTSNYTTSFALCSEKGEILKISEEGGYGHIVGSGDDTHWELCSEEVARSDYKNRSMEVGAFKDGGIFFPEENMVMPFNCGVDSILDVEIPEGIKAGEYKYIDGKFVINVPVRKKAIIKELEELDKIINRSTEDLYAATGVTPYASIEEVIAKKEALRAELAELEKIEE